MEVKVLVGTRNPEAKRPGSINELNEIDGRRKCQTKYSEIEQFREASAIAHPGLQGTIRELSAKRRASL